MKQKNHIRYAYLAGAIDCDGSICIHKVNPSENRRMINPSYILQMIVSGADGRIMDYLYGTFGGAIYFVPSQAEYVKNGKQFGGQPQYRWEVRTNLAAELCKKIVPLLRIKKKQAELAVRFQQVVNKQNNYQSTRSIKLTIKESEIREQMYLEMRRLKKEYLPSAVVETKRDNSSKDEKL